MTVRFLAEAVVAIPDADPLPLPSPPGLLRLLLLVTWIIHLVAMNFVLGGSLIAAAARIAGGERRLRLARALGTAMPTAMAATITFGVAPLLFLQTLYGRLFFTSAVLMAWVWLAIVPVLILAYYATYWLALRRGTGRLAFVAIIVALLLVAISFAQSTNMSMMLRPDRFLPKYLAGASGMQLNLDDPSFAPRWLHMLFGAVAVAGTSVALYGLARRKDDPDLSVWAMRWGALWFAVPTSMNLVIGLWWIGVLPREVVLRFMGGELVPSLALGGGIVAGFAALALALLAAGSAVPDRFVRQGAWAVLATLVLMAVARDGVREGMLARTPFLPSAWVDPQWGPILLFVVLFVAALVTVTWMVATLLRSQRPV